MEVTRLMGREKGGKETKLDFEETELRLGIGLPGDTKAAGGAAAAAVGGARNPNSNGKRGFSEAHDVDLKLNLSSEEEKTKMTKELETEKESFHSSSDATKPPAKAQVVGWPPVRSFRKNILAVQKSSSDNRNDKSGEGGGCAAFIKVSMDGAPYLRKVDVKMYKSYQELSDALGQMFSCFTIIGNKMGLMKESNKVMDVLIASDYVPTYEDQDGDWMLVGDVPWEMFVQSCKRLRIMKGAEAKGLAPRAMEKCKDRS